MGKIRLSILAVLIAPLAFAQEEDSARARRVLYHLARQQSEAAKRLKEQLQHIDDLIEDLRRRNETARADLLERAVKIVTEAAIGVDRTRVAGGGSDEQLQNLELAMLRMAQILEEHPERTAEVQELGKEVVDTLARIVRTLEDRDEVANLEEHERELREVREQARRLTSRQRDLTEQTRNTMPRTPAEKAAQLGLKELEQLESDIEKLDRRAREQLGEIDAARERAARLGDLLKRQQRLRTETAVRAGKVDKLSPRINRALTEMERIARAANRAAEEERERSELSEVAREVAELSERQARILKEIENRAALEHARRGLGESRGMDLGQSLKKAAEATEGPEKEVLKAAAENLKDPGAMVKALNAIQSALDRMASRETLARDESVVARDAERARERAPAGAQPALKEAAEKSRKAARKLTSDQEASDDARAAAEALRKAAEQLAAKSKEGAGDSRAVDDQVKKREEAAARAEALAEELRRIAEEKETQDAGLSGLAEEARQAAKRAAEELRESADAARKEGQAESARRDAEAAAERTETAMRDLRAGMSEREDLPGRQGRIADDLQRLASGTKETDPDRKPLSKAGDLARKAQSELRKRRFGEAGKSQDEVIAELEKLTADAEAAAQAAAQRQKTSLDAAKAATKRAADKAKRIGEDLAKGERVARENDSRRRMKEAKEATEKAEEALRRSLKRLGEAMPKSAEEDRQDSLDHVKDAQRSLRDLREAHRNPDETARKKMDQVAKRQKELEEEVHLLEERLKRLKEKAGVEPLQDAQSAMREAERQLQEGDADEAERAQERAEKSLEQAERELEKEERRYRSLRQFELLFKLKEELKAFRRKAQGQLETLQRIETKVRQAGRVTRAIRKIELDPLRRQVKTLQRDVAEKTEAVAKENAIVYAYILRGCAADLMEVKEQLAAKEVGLIPQELLGDVVRRFDMAIQGMEQNLRERQAAQAQAQAQQGEGRQGEPQQKLVGLDAEIRMVKVLQEELNKDRSNFFENRPDFLERKASVAERRRLERLYHRQGSLAELFDGLRQSAVGEKAEEPLFPGDPEENQEKER